MQYLFPLTSSFLLSVILTGLVRKFAVSRGLVAEPRNRDVHKNPLPRIGGVAIFVAFTITSIIFFLIVHPSLTFGAGTWLGLEKHFVGIWLASLIVVSSMLLDDIYSLKAWHKLLLQFLAVIAIVASGIGIDRLSNPFGNAIDLNSIYIPIITINGITYHFSLISDLLTLVWLVGMMNVMNFVDGVDGLASGIASISALIIFFLSINPSVNQPATALLSIILAGSAMGFLVWNFPPAKIFMGDSGSMFLGLILGILALISGGKLATAFLVLGFPIIDGILVAGSRLLRGENPFTTPDKTHLHHRFLQAGFTPRQSIIALYVISAAFGLLALRFKTINKVISAFVLIVLLLILIKILNYLSRKSVNVER